MKLNKDYKMYVGSEDAFTISVNKLFSYYSDKFFHVANERKTDVKVSKKGVKYSPAGKKLKDKGVKKGVLDFICIEKRHNYTGLVIELKVGKNKCTKEQIEWISKFKSEGYLVEICYSLNHVEDVLKEYFKPPSNNFHF